MALSRPSASRLPITLIAASQTSLFDRAHVKLPLEMVGKRRRPGQKLFEGRRIFLVFDLLCLVTGIEIVLKLPAKIDLFKSIARRFVTDAVVAN